ncbi:MAG: cation:proton antiporter [Alphaproteobacteria bacterium]|nr:cation:proton antiporter [Alphaproteobacteria bacterium]
MDSHASGLVSTLVISLVAAFAGGLAVRSIKLPPLLGYLVAGIVIGPFTPGFAANQVIGAELAEVGVALLLFNIGLHFSLKDLMAVRAIAVRGALVQILISGSLGALAAWRLLDCNLIASLLMGFSTAIASTAITTRVLEEKHQLSTYSGHIALGWLVVQDIVVILALVLFPAFAKTGGHPSGPLAATLGKTLLQIAGFGVVMFVGGRRIIPSLLGYVARIGSRELFTLAVIVVALGIAYGSSLLFGVSLALGAFFAGVVIAESDLNHHAAAEALSMQQIFTILFFVSMGMLFDPRSIIRMPLDILAFWAVIVLGMGLVTFVILLLLRTPPVSAALIGGAFSQIGEFSFVLSGLGLGWGLLSKSNSDLIVAVAFVSIVMNPLLIEMYLALARSLGKTKLFLRWHDGGEPHIPDHSQPLVGHVILVGHGRVGQIVSGALSKHDIPCVIIESDRRLMEKLRQSGAQVIFGDAARDAVLNAAHPETANLIILTVPEGPQVRRIITLIKRLYPELEVIARVHSDTDYRLVARLGAGLAVMGEREIALGLSAYALQHYGVESQIVLETLSTLRHEPLMQKA